ncbi:MAG: acyl-CoA thioesterase [Leptospiraceae bacterium]|nr:acyl-CoA thioesterase [Leptospiraceae bacterium]
MIYNKTFQTNYYDLDWNRHVTSRVYEKMAYAARIEILNELGHPIADILKKNWKWVSQNCTVRFHSQQYSGSELRVDTEVYRDSNSSYHFHQKIVDKNEGLVCTIGNKSVLLDENSKPIEISSIQKTDSDLVTVKLNDRESSWKTLVHSMYVPFSDMNCFWNLPADSVMKIFEEGRFLFFHEVVDLSLVTSLDTTTFFMGGEIEILELPEPGSTITLHTWIDELEKIRFYFRQDIVSSDGKVLVKMKDEQLFIALSKSRPRKAPIEFLEEVKDYCR